MWVHKGNVSVTHLLLYFKSPSITGGMESQRGIKDGRGRVGGTIWPFHLQFDHTRYLKAFTQLVIFSWGYDEVFLSLISSDMWIKGSRNRGVSRILSTLGTFTHAKIMIQEEEGCWSLSSECSMSPQAPRI